MRGCQRLGAGANTAGRAVSSATDAGGGLWVCCIPALKTVVGPERSCRRAGGACPEPAQPAPATEPLTDGGGQARLHRLLLLLQLGEELLGMAADLHRSLGLNVACGQLRGRGGAMSSGGHRQQWGGAAPGASKRGASPLRRAVTCPARLARHALSILRHCLPWRRSASTKRSCSSSVHRSRCLVMV